MVSKIKNLFSISITDCLQSLIPILAWYIVGIIYNDSDYFNIFTLTYYFQFIYMSIFIMFISGSIKYAAKSNKGDMSLGYCGIIEGVIVMLLFVIVASLNVDMLINYFHVGTKYKPFYILSLVFLTLDMVTCGIAKIMQYEDRDKDAFKFTITYQIVKCVSIIIPRLLHFINKDIFGVNITVTLTGILLTIYVIVTAIKHMQITKIHINCLIGWRIEASVLVSEIGMLIIYFFGLQKSVSGSVEFLTAYNIAAMCTDTQWDILSSAIDTNTTKEICDGTYDKNEKQILEASVIYSIILFMTSLAMIIICRTLFTFNIQMCLTVFLIECSTFMIYAISYSEEAWLKINYIGKPMAIITIISYVARIILSLTLQSKYRLSLAILILAIYGFIAITILYNIKRKSKKQQ